MTKTSVTLRLDDELLARLDAMPGESRHAKGLAALEKGLAGRPAPFTADEMRTDAEAFVMGNLAGMANVFNPPGFGKRYDAGPIRVKDSEPPVREPAGVGKEAKR